MVLRPAVLLSVCLPFAVDAAELRAVMGVWDYDISGSAREDSRFYDFERDLRLETTARRSAIIEVDTPPGAWPDWAVSYSKIGAEGSQTRRQTVLIGGVPVSTTTETTEAQALYDDYEVTLRYPVTLGRLRLAGGVTARRLVGTLDIEDSAAEEPSHQQYDEMLPQLHAQLRWPLSDWFTIWGAGYGVEYKDSYATEWRAGAELRLFSFLLIDVGWQEKQYKLELEDYALDAQFDGVLVRGGFVWRP